MALSDNPIRREQKSTKNKSLYAGTNEWWSDRQKLEAVQTYMLLGNATTCAAVLKIPVDTLRRWRRMQWWADIENDLKVQDEIQLSVRLKKIAEKSLEVVEDRLEHGNWVYDQKTGAVRRIGVNAKDAHKIAVDLYDKRDKILGRQGPATSEEGVEQKLAALAEKFAGMVNKHITPPDDVVDAEVKTLEDSHDMGPPSTDPNDDSST